MNTPNETLFRFSVAAVLLSLVAAGSAHAACEWSDRIEVDSAECLEGEWENRSWPWKDTAWVESKCSEWGTVVAKVDRQGAADWTKWLENASRVNMSGAYGNVRGIHCCSDLGDLCNKTDVLNPEGCMAQFQESPAYDTRISADRTSSPTRSCVDITATADVDAETCTIGAQCRVAGGGRTRHRVSEITVPYPEVSELKICFDTRDRTRYLCR